MVFTNLGTGETDRSLSGTSFALLKVLAYNSSRQVIDALAEREGGLIPIRPQEGMLCIARYS